MEITDRTKELETKKISSLLLAYALPSIISQIIASLYNITDRVCIGQGVDAMAISGLTITFPFMNIIHAFGSLVGAGAGARMSIVLGQKDVRWAEKILGNAMLLTFIFGALFLSVGYIYIDEILVLLGAIDENISYARDYMLIVLPGMFFTTLSFNLTGMIRSSGYPMKSMFILGGGAILNIILDLIFIFVFNWGIAGAAWATTISMTATSVAAVLHFVDKKSFIQFRKHSWQPKLYIFRNILMIGISPFLMNIAAAGVVGILNHQITFFGGANAVAAFGIVNSILNMAVLIILGLCQGMQPIAGYNYGAGLKNRLREVLFLVMKINMLIGLVFTILACLFPRIFASAFTNDANLIELSVPCFRFMVCMMPLIGFTITNSNFFQSIDKPWVAITTSLLRQVIILLPLIYLMPRLFVSMNLDGLTGIWAAATTSDFLAAVISGALLYSQRKLFTCDK
ncbi:MAG: MATE family efflux transporter [Bacteroidales bacterium]|nr:MATE family efflux transporter [Bacteroidales bacterium]